MDAVFAYETFDVTATTIPCSGTVMSDVAIPPRTSPSWPIVRVY